MGIAKLHMVTSASPRHYYYLLSTTETYDLSKVCQKQLIQDFSAGSWVDYKKISVGFKMGISVF